MNKIAYGLKNGRKQKGYSVKEVSEFLTNKGFKAGEKTIYSWESGNSQPTPDIFLTLCMHYGINDVLEKFGYEELNPVSQNNEYFKTKSIHLSQQDTEILSLYNQLDEGDKGEIRGEIKYMLKSEKYTEKLAKNNVS